MSDKFTHHKSGSPSVPCRVHGGRTITVTVIEKYSKKPFKGARVTLTPPDGAAVPSPQTTDENGIAKFKGLTTGRYTCSATHHEWGFVETGERLHGASELTMVAFHKKVRWGIDSNLGDDSGTLVIDLETFHQQKKTFIGRYLSLDPQSHPQLDQYESPRYTGIDMFAIWEKDKYRVVELGNAADEKQAGQDDAHQAVYQLNLAGAPKGSVIYFTADFTVKRKLITKDTKLIHAYFEGVKSVIHPSRIGAYGTYTALYPLLELGWVTYGWQMVQGSKGNEIDNRIRMYQYDIWPSTAGWGVAGSGALDLDCAVQEDFGQFRFPF